MNSIGITIPTGTQMSEVKLKGKFDLSMWRGYGDGDDNDTEDSSIDFSLSPKSPPPPVISSNNNPINDNLAVLPINSTTTSALSNRNQASAKNSFLFPPDRDFRSLSATSGTSEESHENELQLSQSHNQQHYHEQQLGNNSDNDDRDRVVQELTEKQQIGINEHSKGGAKKVEFSEDTLKTSMGVDEHSFVSQEKSKRPDSSSKGAKRQSRSQSRGALLNEIRKMSLASQDAEEEKKKLALAGGQILSPAKKGTRRYRRRKRREEEYTDKDRAAAVTLGSRDIKQSLKAKKKRERKTRLYIDLLSSEDYLSSMLVVEASYQLRVKKQPTAALATLNKALELQPTHKGALVARSQCHLRLGDANLALKDAETSFGQNETYIQGLFQYAEALYQLGEFEKALIAYHQGYRLRKDVDGFRIGVQKSQEAIRRAIGDRSATKMGNLDEILSIIEELQESKRKAVSTCTEEDLLMNILKRRFGEKAISLPKLKTKSKNQWITREVLGQMYLDKDYLAKFIHRPDVKKQMGHADELRETATEGLKYLESREQFWRQQNPLYARKTMTNRINNNSLLAKISSSSASEATKLKSRQLKEVEGQTSLNSTPRSALKTTNKVDANNKRSVGNLFFSLASQFTDTHSKLGNL